MAKDNDSKDSPPEIPPAQAPEAKPQTKGTREERAKKSGWTPVKATAPIGEANIDGEIVRYKKGDVFLTAPDRARALGKLVTKAS